VKIRADRTAVMSDEEIVELYWQRDEQAIKATDIKYRKNLISIATNILHDKCDSEECLNDTYIGAWNSIPPAKPAFLQSYLATIMRRTAINRFNANQTQKRIVSEFTVSLSELEDIIKSESDIGAEADEKELAKTISEFVRSLPERQMYIFVGRFYMAESIPKISRELGCSVSTVKREIRVIKEELKKKLEGEGYVL
jgi:RNA polymerase sigma-70 factor (ECF subfamily)